MTLRRSDVVITRPCSMEDYRRYRATALAWGFLPEPDRRGLSPDGEMMRDVDEAHRCGAKFQGRVELDADWIGMIDYDPDYMDSVVRDIEGRPQYTWWTHRYRGNPSWHFCTNAPGYRRYLFHQLDRVMKAGTDWLMIDSAIPTIGALTARYGGCFCRHCMAGFRDWLAQNTTPEQLAAEDVEDICRFDWGEWLRERGVDDSRYRENIQAFPPTIPLAGRYFDYQWGEVDALFREFKRRAQEYRDDYVPMSSNSPWYWPQFPYAVEAHDFYTNELEYHPPEREVFPTSPIYVLKLAEALGRIVGLTGIPRAFEPYRLRPRPGHIRLWMAQAAALGHVFMVPAKMWTLRVPGEADRWYYSDPGDYEEICHFIRDHAGLLDEYESLASVALVFSNLAVRRFVGETRVGRLGGQERSAPDTPLHRATLALTHANIPARLLVAGDGMLPDQLATADLDAFQAVVRFEPSPLTEEQETRLQRASDRLHTFRSTEALLATLERPLTLEGAAGIVAVPRHQPQDPGAPAIVHLLNTNYDAEGDAYHEQREFTLVLKHWLYGREFSGARLHAPGEPAQALDCVNDDDETRVRVSRLDMWAILELE
ncbi:MAG: hypothetical protein OXF32_01635 [Anaerolineaceae bacterium]|nr:hypothetical protein [Anaerolineaceae bacterium]